jgi:hypothetical protein
MRIFVQSANADGSAIQAVQKACAILQEASIHSARGGGMINDRPFVLIDARDVPEAMAVLRKAGVRAVME